MRATIVEATYDVTSPPKPASHRKRCPCVRKKLEGATVKFWDPRVPKVGASAYERRQNHVTHFVRGSDNVATQNVELISDHRKMQINSGDGRQPRRKSRVQTADSFCKLALPCEWPEDIYSSHKHK